MQIQAAREGVNTDENAPPPTATPEIRASWSWGQQQPLRPGVPEQSQPQTVAVANTSAMSQMTPETKKKPSWEDLKRERWAADLRAKAAELHRWEEEEEQLRQFAHNAENKVYTHILLSQRNTLT
jgi:hypothetical protein